METHAEQSPQESPSYRSPLRVLVRAFQRSRDRWKAKYMALQERIKAFRTEVRDLRRARDRWRAKAEALQQEVNALRVQGRPRVAPSPPAPRRPSPQAPTPLSR
jgi:chromosome segregation ATPase